MFSRQLEPITVTLWQSLFAPLLCMVNLCCLFKDVLGFDSVLCAQGEMGRLRSDSSKAS